MANEFKVKKGLIVTGATGGTVVDIQGSQGQLFSVTDNLTGSNIFAVSDISGVPILQCGVDYGYGNVSIDMSFNNGYTLNVGSTGNGSIITTGRIFCGDDFYVQGEAIIPSGPVIVGLTSNFNGSATAKVIVKGNQTFGLPGLGVNNNGRWLSIEGNADASGEGSGRIFFTEHNSTTAAMDNYGMSIGYRGGSTSVVGASGNTWTGLASIGNGEWGMWGHNNDAVGAMIMSGDRAATYVSFRNNIAKDISNLYVAGNIYHTGDTNNYISFGTDVQSFVTNGTSRIYINTDGNVGIGTVTPGSNRLHVRSSGRAAYIYSDQSTGLTVRGGGNSQDIAQFENIGGSTVAVINSAGSVGIGTTTPVDKFTVVNTGTANFGYKKYATYSGSDSGAGTGNGFIASLNDEQGTTLTSQYQYKFYLTTTGTGTYNSSVYIVYRNAADSAWIARAVSLGGGSSNHPLMTISGNNAIIYDGHSSSYTVRYRVETTYSQQAKTSPNIFGADSMWQNSGGKLFYIDNYVGIGTTSPNQRLHVNGATQLGDINSPTNFGTVALKVVEGTIATGPTLGSGSVGAQAVLYSNGLFGMYTGVSGSGDTWMQSQRNDANTATYDILLNPLGGRVAIGHNNPVGWLDVFRTGTNYAVNLSDTLNRAGLVVKSSGAFDSKIAFSSGAGSRQYIQAVNNAGNTGRDIAINPYGGNVGIGTSAPGQKLTVNGRALIQNSTTPFYIKVNSTYKSWVHHIASNDAYILAPSTADGGETWDWANQTSFSTSGIVTANNFVLSSDKRNKTKIEDLTGDNVDISWKSFEMKGNEGEYRTGVIAQELEENHPEFVSTDDKGFKSVKYIDLLIAKIAELEARLEILEK